MKNLIKLSIIAAVFAVVMCLEDFESATAGFESIEESNREPLSLDYVEGEFPSYTPKQPSLPPSASSGNPFGTSDLFQHHFGNFFDFNPFPNFGSSGFGSFGLNSFNFDSFKPWHSGPNVCTTRDESTESDGTATKKQKQEGDISSSEVETLKEPSFFHHFSLNVESCQETSNKHICKRITNQQGQKKTVTITKQCCHGFARQPPQGFCEKVELHSLEEISKTLNTSSFIEVAENNGLKEVMQTSNVTLFMPSDESFKTYSQNSLNEADNSAAMKDLLLNHVVKGLFDIEEIDNEDVLQTEYENHTIRLNVFPKIRSRRGNDDYRYLYTANCVPIKKANMRSTNGIVHKTQGVLKPVSKSLMDIIRSRDDMTVLRTVLEKTQMDKKLDGSVGGKDFTIFAPNDAAFEKLDAQFKRKIKEGGSCAEKIMENHILQLTFCSAAVIDDDSRVSAYNILGERMTLEKSTTENDENSTDNEINTSTNESPMNLLINGKSRMVEADHMATNGVLHIIDEVLVTETALPPTTMFGNQNLTIFKKLIEYGSFSNDFDNFENVTFIIPSDEAFERSEQGKYWMQMLDESPQKLKNNEKLRKFLEYHVADKMIKTRDLKDEMLTTVGSDRELRVNLYSTMPNFANIMNRATINCARLIHFDQETCGSVVHQIDNVLTAPEMTLMEMLRTTPNYSQFYKLVMKSDLSSLLEEATGNGYTLLVPRDEIFNELQDWLKEKKEAGELDDLIRNHIVPDVKCCAGIVRSQWPFVNSFKTISNNYLSTNRDRRPKIQNAAVTKCDIIAKNGIIHEINDIINVEKPRREEATNNFGGFDSIFNRPFFFKK